VLGLEPDRHLIESNAILVYLADGTPFHPDGPLERSEVVRWLIYEQTDVMPAIGGLRFRLQTGRLPAAASATEALPSRSSPREEI